MNYIKQLDEVVLYGDGIGRVELWDFSRANESHESRIEAVAKVASVCYNKPPKDAKKLVERLQTESGGLPSSAFEFIRSGYMPDIGSSLRNLPALLTGAESASRHRANIATFRIKVPLFIGTQVLRHRSFSPQGLSRRYVQNGIEWWVPFDETPEIRDVFITAYEAQYRSFRRLLELGVLSERARAVLGAGLYTTLWIMGDVDAWNNYLKVRLEAHAQQEHVELAQAIAALLYAHQPEFWSKMDAAEGYESAETIAEFGVFDVDAHTGVLTIRGV